MESFCSRVHQRRGQRIVTLDATARRSRDDPAHLLSGTDAAGGLTNAITASLQT